MKGKRHPLVGTKIGYLRVAQKTASSKGKPAKFRCVCTAPGCGKRITVPYYRLKHNNPKRHCGCLNKGPSVLHPKEYHAWKDAIARCHNPNHPSYEHYGARGIQVCTEWRESFDQFLADIGKAPSKEHSIDRKDNDGNYEPGNVQWATDTMQVRNRRVTKLVRHPRTGKVMPAGQAAKSMRMPYRKFRNMMIERGEW